MLSSAIDAVRTAAIAEGRLAEAHRLTARRLALVPSMDRGSPRDAAEIEEVLAVACTDAVAVGDLPAARAVMARVLDDELHGDYPHLSLSKVLPVLVLNGDLRQARRYAPAMWDGWVGAGRPPAVWLPVAAQFVALAHGLCGDRTAADLWQERAEDAAGPANIFHERHAPLAAFVAARLAVHTGAATTVDVPAAEPGSRYHSYAVAAAAELAVVARSPDAADRLAAAGATENAWAQACLARAAGRLRGDEVALAASVAEWERIGARFERAVTLLLLPDRADEGRAELAALVAS